MDDTTLSITESNIQQSSSNWWWWVVLWIFGFALHLCGLLFCKLCVTTWSFIMTMFDVGVRFVVFHCWESLWFLCWIQWMQIMGHRMNCYMIGFWRRWKVKHLQFVGFVVEVWFLVNFSVSYFVTFSWGRKPLCWTWLREEAYISLLHMWFDRWSSGLEVEFKDHNSREMMKISRDFGATLMAGHSGGIRCLVYTLKFYWIMLLRRE